MLTCVYGKKARMQLIIEGTAYAPSGMLAQSYGPTVNYYTEFGVTRKSFEMSLNDQTGDILSEVEPIIGYVPRQPEQRYCCWSIPCYLWYYLLQ